MNGRSSPPSVISRRVALMIVSIAMAIAIAGPGLAAGKAPPKPKPGGWVGHIGAFSLSFSVSKSGKQITNVRTNYEATGFGCGPPSSTVTTVLLFRSLTIRDGAFQGVKAITYPSGITFHFTMRGAFKRATLVTGTMNESFAFPNNSQPPCNETDPLSATHIHK